MLFRSKGYSTEIERLITKGADVDAQTYEGVTPLVFAVANNHLPSVLTLLSHGPQLNKHTADYETPLSIAVKNQNLEITEALLRAGADISITDNHGATPLHYSAIYGSFYITDLLLYYEAECDKKANDGTTPLMAAIWAGYADIADLLIQNGANMVARDKEGFTPFLIAAQNGDTLMMNLLLKAGVDLYERNIHNYNALSIAISTNHKPAVDLLLEKGQSWAASDSGALNPYRIASVYGRKDLIEALYEKNVPGSAGLRIDELAISPSARFTGKDFYSGLSITFKAPLINSGIIAGVDSKLWYTRVLMKESENLFYQYMDKSSVVYAGVFKDFIVAENQFRSSIAVSASLSAAYFFGNRFKGTNLSPDNKFTAIPAVTLKLMKKNFIFSGGLEYMNTGFYHIGPVWVRTGFAYNFFLSKIRAPGKIIKWY